MEEQRLYFEALKRQFAAYKGQMREQNLSPSEIARAHTTNSQDVNRVLERLDAAVEQVKEIWTAQAASAVDKLAASPGLRCSYAGRIAPLGGDHILASSLYFDTLIIPDPVTRISSLGPSTTDEMRAALALNNILTTLELEDASQADVSPPMVAVVPAPTIVNPQLADEISTIADSAYLGLASGLLGTNFNNIEHIRERLSALSDVDALRASMAKPELFLLGSDATGTLDEQLNKMRHRLDAGMASGGEHFTLAELVEISLRGRVSQAAEAWAKAEMCQASPLVDNATAWRALTFCNAHEPDDVGSREAALVNGLIARGLQGHHPSICMVSGLPVEGLIELRKQGALPELRSLLAAGMQDVRGVNPDELAETMNCLAGNIEAMLQQHGAAVQDLCATFQRNYRDAAIATARLSLAVAAALVGIPWLSVLAATVGSLGLPSIVSAASTQHKLLETDKKLQRSPAAILLKYLT